MPLPISSEFQSSEEYITSLLQFITISETFQTLCGGVHILDFFTRSPDLYETVFPLTWREWFDEFDSEWDIVDWVLRSDLSAQTTTDDSNDNKSAPDSLLEYIRNVRRHFLTRDPIRPSTAMKEDPRRPKRSKETPSLQQRLVGMSLKKQHEVANFAAYLADLADRISQEKPPITHFIDFGSGANYLGRVLANKPYERNIVAIESRDHVVKGAKKLDVQAKMAKREIVIRNKKEIRRLGGWKKLKELDDQSSTPELNVDISERSHIADPTGRMQYIHHQIHDGDLSDVIQNIESTLSAESVTVQNNQSHPLALVMSLHSCGTLVNHGLRTLTLNPAVKVVAMIGCCYNLISERLPTLQNPYDQHGFPMSSRLYRHHPSFPGVEQCCQSSQDCNKLGLRLNITSRMMAVQAPRNWTRSESDQFFKRHFYRALLQRIFSDLHIVEAPKPGMSGRSPAGTGGTDPIVIGSLPKSSYVNFVTYVRSAVDKMIKTSQQHYNEQDAESKESDKTPAWVTPPIVAQKVHTKMSLLSDSDIAAYEESHLHRKKHLSVLWTLMAFSAELIEAVVIVDRWLWLQEQECVEEAWVESVWEYQTSPRNLVIVGIKK
jgi:Methyltransferase domain